MSNNEATYFMSGSNHAGEIEAMSRFGQAYGVAVDALDKSGNAMGAMTSRRKSVVVGVTRNAAGKPIVMFNRDRDQYSDLPEGDVPVIVDGQELVVGFRKVAANVAKVAGKGANVLGQALKGLFGAAAGERGAGHKVVIELTPAGWEMSKAELDAIKASGAEVFVDSGAFSEVQLNAPAKDGSLPFPGEAPFSFVTVNEITDAEWNRRLDLYTQVAAALGDRAYLVAPDKVGDQTVTLERLAKYADRVRELRALGANIIVPIQKGAMAQIDFDAAVTEVLGFSDYVRGIPSKKAAATVEEIATFANALDANARIHLLGLGPDSRRYPAVMEALANRTAALFCDSVRLRALVGRTNGKGGGPRVLTQLRDHAETLVAATVRGFERARRVKFLSVSAYLSNVKGLSVTATTDASAAAAPVQFALFAA